MDLEERQIGAVSTGLFFLLVLPALICLPLILGTAWMAVLGLHPHAALWGWLSDRHHVAATKQGGAYTSWSIARWIGAYFISVPSAYLTYQVGELLAGGFRAFRHALVSS